MSYDIFVQDLPARALSIEEIPADFVPGPIGPLARIRDVIRAVVPGLTFNDAGWATIEEAEYSIEVNLGTDDPVQSFAFHVRGTEVGLYLVAEILRSLALRALAPGTETGFFSLEGDTREAYARWRAYRDHV